LSHPAVLHQMFNVSALLLDDALTFLRLENVTFIEPDMWPLNSRTWIQSITLFGCPSTDGLSTSTIHDNHPTEAGDRHWVEKTIPAFHWSIKNLGYCQTKPTSSKLFH